MRSKVESGASEPAFSAVMDHYTKVRVIGKGSYGEVWLVKHKRDRKQYVLKKMEISNASRRERKAAEQEAKLLAKLKHPNICSYKDSFETTDGLLYIAMGYCEGGDLYHRLKEQKGTALEERQVVEWFVQIAMALQYMHERNILHRDLKTQNIFLTKSKIIKVGDLGIARVLDNSNDMATTLIGTPYYMSPELFSNKPYNHKSDVWALGCCVYEMATLKHAFNARDMNSLVYKILRGRMPSMPKQYSSELVTLIRAMLNSNPEKRPSVNRILRDPYIKKNIAIFLESTRKHTSNKPANNRRSSADSQRNTERRSSNVSSVGDEVPDSARSSVSNASSVASVGKAYDRASRVRAPLAGGEESSLEPLHVGPDLEPIQEEPTPRSEPNNLQGSGDSRTSATPTRSRSNTPTRSRPHTPSKHLHSSSSSSSRDLPPTGRNSPSRQNQKKKRQRAKRDSDSEKDRGPNPQRGVGSHRDNHQVNKPSKNNRVFNNAKPVENPRPLPPHPNPGREPANSLAVPKKSQSRRTATSEKDESGYGSVSSSVNSSKDDPGRDETPRQSVNLSARARRREKKESETPRTARSLDVDHRRQDDKTRPQSARVAKSADYYPLAHQGQGDPDREPTKGRPHSANIPEKASGGGRKLPRQPSLTEESSSDSDTEVDGARNPDKSEKERKKHVHVEICERNVPYARPLPSPITEYDEPDSAPCSDWQDRGHNANVAEENEKEEEEDEVRKEKEMNSFISILNSTLQLNNSTPTNEGEETGEKDEGVDDVDEVDGPGDVGETEEEPQHQEIVVSNFDYEPIRRPDLSRSHAPDISSLSPVKTLGTSTRLMDRITALRKDCIRGLGVEKLKNAYDILDDVDGDQLEEELVLVLGRTDFDVYAGKIWQLKFCEEAAFGII